ncbi:hypothetical protein GCM10023334_012120 [Nonomuraea thailandensis]
MGPSPLMSYSYQSTKQDSGGWTPGCYGKRVLHMASLISETASGCLEVGRMYPLNVCLRTGPWKNALSQRPPVSPHLLDYPRTSLWHPSGLCPPSGPGQPERQRPRFVTS